MWDEVCGMVSSTNRHSWLTFMAMIQKPHLTPRLHFILRLLNIHLQTPDAFKFKKFKIKEYADM